MKANEEEIFRKLGTLCHNRTCTARDVTDYTGVDGSASLRRWRKLGLVKGAKGAWFPTMEGWALIEKDLR